MRALRYGLVFGFAILPVAACSSDEEKSGGNGTASCVPQAAECYLSGPEGPGAECLAKHDNSGSDKWQGRLTQITVKAPQKLAEEFVQTEVIDLGISLNQPQCYEFGEGTFSWLFEVDKTTGQMRTGGAPPIKNPAEGSCFLTLTTTSLPIQPINVNVDIAADGRTFTAEDIDPIFVPVFSSPDDLTNPIILPLHKVDLTGTFNSDAHNCIGKFNGDTLDPITDCKPYYQAGERSWTTGGTLAGYITIEEADQVFVEELGNTLCVWLAGVSEWKGPDDNCKSTDAWIGGARPEGDWCSQTNTAATDTCKDAWRLEGDFAAAAIKINGDCQ